MVARAACGCVRMYLCTWNTLIMIMEFMFKMRAGRLPWAGLGGCVGDSVESPSIKGGMQVYKEGYVSPAGDNSRRDEIVSNSA